MSSSGFWTSLMALLSIGNAYLSKASGSLMGGPEINTAKSGNAGGRVTAWALSCQSKAGEPVINPNANAIEIAHSFNEKLLLFCPTCNPQLQSAHNSSTAFHYFTNQVSSNQKSIQTGKKRPNIKRIRPKLKDPQTVRSFQYNSNKKVKLISMMGTYLFIMGVDLKRAFSRGKSSESSIVENLTWSFGKFELGAGERSIMIVADKRRHDGYCTCKWD